MADWQLKTPVAFLIFNRPDTTVRVFNVIRAAKPPKLLVVADGPRTNRSGESDMCQAARAIVQRVDWPCEVLANYSDVNLGCKRRISSGLDWVFNNVEEAIILEDDCMPHPSFFRYCEELLVRYRDDMRVMTISGSNFLQGSPQSDYSYYFSLYPLIWGWASWSRSWVKYDVEMKLWPENKRGAWARNFVADRDIAEHWRRCFSAAHKGHIDTWDFQYVFASWLNQALTVIPSVNLVSNIGFSSSDATHVPRSSVLANLPTEEMSFPLRHPLGVARDSRADKLLHRKFFRPWLPIRMVHRLKALLRPGLFQRVRNKFLSFISG